ncbi:hypothetical protein Y032_0765g2161 [Ancylostoma ceylanicum]|uniref:Uncharacterized protein n=1 Tax=Ancylostoma ceylanicum TaxID=53326 RepID=A0A016WDW9_9BILA|nr:hypothetical protein Y032_0765g2161 [Ancylostoma ceylanicum]
MVHEYVPKSAQLIHQNHRWNSRANGSLKVMVIRGNRGRKVRVVDSADVEAGTSAYGSTQDCELSTKIRLPPLQVMVPLPTSAKSDELREHFGYVGNVGSSPLPAPNMVCIQGVRLGGSHSQLGSGWEEVCIRLMI